MKWFIALILLLLIFAIAATLPNPRNRSCDYLKKTPTESLLLQCLFGRK